MCDKLNNGSRNCGTELRIYTDGSCYNNADKHHAKGIGSWAFVTYDENMKIAEVYAQFHNGTTNNRMEMLAIINALKLNNGAGKLSIISDSGYVVKGYNHPAYLDRWKANGWKTSSGSDVMNIDLWEELLKLSYHTPFVFTLIRGHNKDVNAVHAFWNSIVDKACTWMVNNYQFENHLIRMEYDFDSGSFVNFERIG